MSQLYVDSKGSLESAGVMDSHLYGDSKSYADVCACVTFQTNSKNELVFASAQNQPLFL